MTDIHSPWGTIWSIASATGWTMQYILWGTSWLNIQMMIADSPRRIKEKVKELETEEDLKRFLKID